LKIFIRRKSGSKRKHKIKEINKKENLKTSIELDFMYTDD